MKMNSKKAFYILVAAISVLILVAGFLTYQAKTVLTTKGDELADLKAQSAVFNDREEALNQAKIDIIRYAELEKIAKAIVPQEKDQARTVRELTLIAEQTGVPIASIQFPASALGEVQRGAARKKINPATSQLTPVPGTKGLYAMEITVQSDRDTPIAYSNLLSFLEQLEQNRRTAHVVNLSINPEAEDRNLVTFAVTLNVYIKP